jgi:hypothetical protein
MRRLRNLLLTTPPSASNGLMPRGHPSFETEGNGVLTTPAFKPLAAFQQYTLLFQEGSGAPNSLTPWECCFHRPPSLAAAYQSTFDNLC